MKWIYGQVEKKNGVCEVNIFGHIGIIMNIIFSFIDVLDIGLKTKATYLSFRTVNSCCFRDEPSTGKQWRAQ